MFVAPSPEPLPDVRPTGPLELPACGDVPPASADAPAGLVLPDASAVTSSTPVDPVVNVTGYVALTPSNFRRTFEDREGVELLTVEDETFDMEVLYTDGEHRVYVKALAVCAEGSEFVAVVAPESVAQGQPAPSGPPVPPG